MSDSSTISYVDVCSIRWLSGESIPIRLFLAGYDLTPTFKDVNKKFSVRYYLNLVLIDEEERRYFKQQVRTMYVAWHFNAVPTIQFPISKFVPFHPFLVVMMAAKDRKSVSCLKLEPFIPTDSTNVFLLFDPFIVSVFGPACADKSGDFSPFHSIVYVHPPPTYSLCASASFTDRL